MCKTSLISTRKQANWSFNVPCIQSPLPVKYMKYTILAISITIYLCIHFLLPWIFVLQVCNSEIFLINHTKFLYLDSYSIVRLSITGTHKNIFLIYAEIRVISKCNRYTQLILSSGVANTIIIWFLKLFITVSSTCRNSV